MFESLFSGEPDKSAEQKAIERAFGEGRELGRSGGGDFELFGADLPIPIPDFLISSEYKARIAGIREGKANPYPREPDPVQAAGGSGRGGGDGSSAAGWDGTAAASRSSGNNSWFGTVYMGVCTLILLTYFALEAINVIHPNAVTDLAGIQPTDDFWAAAAHLWTWSENPALRQIIQVLFFGTLIFLIPGLIIAGLVLAAVTIVLSVFGLFVELALILHEYGYPIAALIVGLLDVAIFILALRALVAHYVPAPMKWRQWFPARPLPALRPLHDHEHSGLPQTNVARIRAASPLNTPSRASASSSSASLCSASPGSAAPSSSSASAKALRGPKLKQGPAPPATPPPAARLARPTHRPKASPTSPGRPTSPPSSSPKGRKSA